MRLFFATFVAGLALVLIAAGLFPLPEHERFRSRSDVLTGGGRQEDFVIRWPEDRIGLPRRIAGTQATDTPGTAVLRAPGGELAGVELFRLRDVDGNIVGMASRSTTRVPSRQAASASTTNWMLLLPSRGSLLLTQQNSADIGPVAAPNDADRYVSPIENANFWSRGARYRITAGPARSGQGRVVRGSAEFAGLSGSYTEIWELDEVAADGTTEGQISLATVTQRAR